MAQAMLTPSYVLVPRPISSNSTRLRGVRLLRMAAVSFISTMKVDSPLLMLSDAPTRVNIRSRMPKSACLAGTNDPDCAIKEISAVCRNSALLPDMLGPVTIRICRVSGSSWMSLAT